VVEIGENPAGLVELIKEAFAIRNQLLSGSHDSIEAMSGRLRMTKGYLMLQSPAQSNCAFAATMATPKLPKTPAPAPVPAER